MTSHLAAAFVYLTSLLSVMQAILQDAGFPVPDAATLRSGHMKNAINVPYPTLYGEDKVSFKTKEELMKSNKIFVLSHG